VHVGEEERRGGRKERKVRKEEGREEGPGEGASGSREERRGSPAKMQPAPQTSGAKP
jgi:hypothetical protein